MRCNLETGTRNHIISHYLRTIHPPFSYLLICNYNDASKLINIEYVSQGILYCTIPA